MKKTNPIIIVKNWFVGKPLITKIFVVVIITALGWYGIPKIFGQKTAKVEFQTAEAEKGMLVTSVTASGNISAGNNITIQTNATGTVNNVYVKLGDRVIKGQKIADMTLDQDSTQKQAAAWSSYLSSKNQLASAQAKMNSLQSAAFKANQKFMTDADFRDLATNDPVYIQEYADWLQAEADYKNQSGNITQAQASMTSAWYAYQQISQEILAPAPGIITNLNIAPGATIVSQSSSSNSNNGTPQQVGTITQQQGHIQAIVSLSEIDAAKVSPGQKVSLNMDAFTGKTFVGKVLMINTNGTVSSGVTTYPATIEFDSEIKNIYPNMAVTAKIITSTKDNVILVPSAAVQTSNGQSIVRVMKKGQITSLNVETGETNDTQTEIISGINEGDIVVTNFSSSVEGVREQGQQGNSPFSGLGRGGFGGGSGAVFRMSR